MANICLSAGHGTGDVGAVYKDLTEASLTSSITNRAAEIVRAHSVGCLVVPETLTLVQTISWINARALQLNLCVEVHINSGGGTGVEAWDYAGPSESDRLARFLADAMAAETGLRNRGIKDETTNRHGRLGFVHDTAVLAALVECGFIDGDYNFFKTSTGIEKMARGVARGCLGYLGIAWKPELLNLFDPPVGLTAIQKLEKIAALCVGTGQVYKYKIRQILQS